MRIPKSIIAIALGLSLLGAGCISFSKNGAGDGALFLSTNRGDTWGQRGALLTAGGSAQTLGGVNVRFIIQDAADPRALYVGTDANGAYMSWDGGATWQTLGVPFAQARVDAIALHPTDRCTFSVAAGRKVFQSSDCGRTWDSSDFDVTISALVRDPRTPSVLYAGNTQGDVLKSADGGRSWKAVERFGQPVLALRAVPFADSTAIIVGTRNGIMRSTNGGTTWDRLRKGLEQFPAAFEYRDIITAPKTPGVLLYASKHGILRSRDLGSTWESIPLLTAPGSVDITGIAVSPKDSTSIVYTTESTYYRTTDSGAHWESKKLPTSRRPSALLVDTRDAKAVWLGTRVVKK